MSQEQSTIYTTLLVDQVYMDIKKRIIRGELQPNYKLSIRNLCEYYHISDTPLKQALNRLVSEHLVDALPRRGMRVRCITQRDIREAIEARIMIELYATASAIRCSSESKDLINKLEENIKKDEHLVLETGDLSLYSEKAQEELEVSQEFHKILVNSTNNQVISNAYQGIVNHRYVYYQFGKNKMKQVLDSIKEHKDILECLKAGNEEGMRKAIIAHLQAREYDVSSARGAEERN